MAPQDYDVVDDPDEELLGAAMDEAPVQRRRVALRPVLVLLTGLALVATVFAMGTRDRHGHPSALMKANPGAVTSLAAQTESTCDQYPFLHTFKLLHNDFEGSGPFTSGGLRYEAKMEKPNESPEPVELHVTIAEGSTLHPGNIGPQGFHNVILTGSQFMSINIKEDSEVVLDFKITEPGKTTPINIDEVDFSFFDIDKHERGNAESVECSGYQSHLTYEGTELEITEKGLNHAEFKATVVGTGADNPNSPDDLTEAQLIRAVSFNFKPFRTAQVTFRNGPNTGGQTHGRRFDFIGMPSLKCAKGVDPDKIRTFMPTCCLLKVGPVNLLCAPANEKSWYHFMC